MPRQPFRVAPVPASGERAHLARMTTSLPTAPAADPASGPRALSRAECRALLARVGWGVLATVGDGHPYAVPVGYALGRDCIYVASGPGEKRRCLDDDPRVCLTVCEVDDFARWRSVVVRGEAVPVAGLAARTVALAAFAAQRSPRRRTDAASARRFASAYLVRLSLDGMTGRSRGHDGDA